MTTALEKAQIDYFVCKAMHKKRIRRFLRVVPGPAPHLPPKFVTVVSTKSARDAARLKIKALTLT